ncbi:hypothetical protein MKEN_00632600 [Mycena kentingensis (nom. inval.)]|nr:hypothetical protein MKEN_00632600 [Mycena kentingensis (nom. inval.)]
MLFPLLVLLPTARAVTPVFKAITLYGSLSDRPLNRDSPAAPCRDTQQLTSAGVPRTGSIANTASWSGKPSPTAPGNLVLSSPQGFGSLFLPLESDECRAGVIYLYGKTPDSKLAVARSALTGFLKVRSLDKDCADSLHAEPLPVEHTRRQPSSQLSKYTLLTLPRSFVYIAADSFPNANFYISTAPAPEGPWTEPSLFYQGSVGNGSLLTYSSVAHPALTDGTGNYIFLTWTKTMFNPTGTGDVYEQPLVRVDWA